MDIVVGIPRSVFLFLFFLYFALRMRTLQVCIDNGCT